jgi:hypothetical protein
VTAKKLQTPVEPTDKLRQVAFNPCTRQWEVVYPESEIPEGAALITQYWCRSGACWVTILE